MTIQRQKSTSCTSVLLGLLWLILTVVVACSSEEQIEPPQKVSPEGFTFFDIHQNTIYSEALRDRLAETLSSDAVEYRSVINLEIVQKGFLQEHFPRIAELNRRLNHPAGERVEHPTIKLMYRWAARKNLPFSYVELLFSQDTRKPLYVKIESTLDISDIVDALSEKYGSPTVLDLQQGRGEIRYWENNRNVFLAAILSRRNERPLYRMMIYYADNLDEFISAQEKKRRQMREKREREGRSAF